MDSSQFFQGRGTLYLAERISDLVGPSKLKLCTDALAIAPKVDSFSHQNKCGPTDVEDARGIKSQTAELTITLADVADDRFALGVLGTKNAAGSPDTVSDEALPSGIEAGDYYFLGRGTRHRNITSLVISDGATVPATLTLDTDYEIVDAERGLIRFLDVSGLVQPFSADYGYTDPASVSMFTAGQKEYFASYEFINKQDDNNKGSLELYRVRFDPADNLDFQSDELQLMTLKGSVLADTTKEADDTELGQFGRRIL